MPKHIFKSKRYVRELRRMALTLAQVSDLAQLLHAHATLVHRSLGAGPPPHSTAPAPAPTSSTAPADRQRSSDIRMNSKIDSCTITHNLAEIPLWLEIDKSGDVRVNLKEKTDLIAKKVASLHFGPNSREIVNGPRVDPCKERLNNLEVISEHSNCSENNNEKEMNSWEERKSTHQEPIRVENDNKEIEEQYDYVSLKENSSFLYSSDSNTSIKRPRSFIDIKITIQDNRSDLDDIFEKQPFRRSVQELHDDPYSSRLTDEGERHIDLLGGFPVQNMWFSESAISTDEEYNQVGNYEENQDGIDCQYSPSYVDVRKEETDEQDQEMHLNIPGNQSFLFNLMRDQIIPEKFSKEMQTDSNLNQFIRNSHSWSKSISETLIGNGQDRKSLEIISEDPISGNALLGSNQKKADENVYDSSKVYAFPDTNIGVPPQNPTISNHYYSAPNWNPSPNVGSVPRSETSPVQSQIAQGTSASRNPFPRDLMEVDKWQFQWPPDTDEEAEGAVKVELPQSGDAWVINVHENPTTTSPHGSQGSSGGGVEVKAASRGSKAPKRKASTLAQSTGSRSTLGCARAPALRPTRRRRSRTREEAIPLSRTRTAARLLDSYKAKGSQTKSTARGRHRHRSTLGLDELLIEQCASLIQLVSQRVAASGGGRVPKRGRKPRKAKSQKRLPGRRNKAFSTSELQPAWEVDELSCSTDLPIVTCLQNEINATNHAHLPREINATNLPDVPSLSSEINATNHAHLPSEIITTNLPHLPNEINATNLPDVPSLSSEINATNLPDVPSLSSEINATNLPDVPSLSSEINATNHAHLPSEIITTNLPHLPNEINATNLPDVPSLSSEINATNLPHLPREINATNLPDVPSLSSEINTTNLPHPPNEINATNQPDVPSRASEIKNQRIHFKDLFYDHSTDECVPTIECEPGCETPSLELKPSPTSCTGTHYLAPICKYLFHNLRPYSCEQNLANINVNYYQSELVLETSLDESNDSEFADEIGWELSKENLEIHDKNYGQNSVNVIRSECSDFIASYPEDNVMNTTQSYTDFAKTFIPQVLHLFLNNSVEEKVAEIDLQEQSSQATCFSESTSTSKSSRESIDPQIRIPTPGITVRFPKEGVRPCTAKKCEAKSNSFRRKRKTPERVFESEIETRNRLSEFWNDSSTSQDSEGWPSLEESTAKENATISALRQTVLQQVAQNSTLPPKSREGYRQHVANERNCELRDRGSTPPNPVAHEPVKRRPFLSKMTTVLKCGFSRCSRGSRCLNKSDSSFDEPN